MLTLAQARSALDAALACAATPLGIAVLDAGGNLVAFVRMDGASLYRFDIARAKAKGALGMGASTRELAARAQNNPAFFLSVTALAGVDLALSPGGVLVRDPHGAVVGAIGVSGDTPDTDEAVALAGAAAITGELM